MIIKISDDQNYDADDDVTYHLFAPLLISIGENSLWHLGSSKPSNVGNTCDDNHHDHEYMRMKMIMMIIKDLASPPTLAIPGMFFMIMMNI